MVVRAGEVAGVLQFAIIVEQLPVGGLEVVVNGRAVVVADQRHVAAPIRLAVIELARAAGLHVARFSKIACSAIEMGRLPGIGCFLQGIVRESVVEVVGKLRLPAVLHALLRASA